MFENDERVRAASAYESVGYERAADSFDRWIAVSVGAERDYWVRVRAALELVAA